MSPTARTTFPQTYVPRPLSGVRLEQHERAVSNTLSWAREAARRGAFVDVLAWLQVIEVIDGCLPGGWHQTRESWRARAGTRLRVNPPQGVLPVGLPAVESIGSRGDGMLVQVA